MQIVQQECLKHTFMDWCSLGDILCGYRGRLALWFVEKHIGFAQAGLTSPVTAIVTGMTLGAAGQISMAYVDLGGVMAGGEVLAFVPTDTGAGITWACNTGTTTLQPQYRPANCR